MKSSMSYPSLLELHSNPGKKVKCVGVILDATKPYRTSRSFDFVTKIKIIDPDLNCSSKIDHEKKYIHVFIYSKDRKEAPKVMKIGDIIYLRLYDFESYPNEKYEVKAKKRLQSSSFYYIFDGDITSENDFSIKSTDDTTNYTIKEELKNKITELRKWNSEFFAKHSLREMNWYGQNEIDINSFRKQDFDMILKLKDIKASNFQYVYDLSLVDSCGNQFFLSWNLENMDENFYQPGDVLKIRSVSEIDNTRTLLPNIYSSILKLPSYYYDCLNLESFMYTFIEKVPAEINLFSKGVGDDYEDPRKDSLTIIKKKYYNLPQTKEVTMLKQLILTKETYTPDIENIAKLNKVFYRVNCYVYEIYPYNLREAVKRLCKKCRKLFDYEIQATLCCEQELTLIWQFCLVAKDFSIDSEPKYIELYVFSHDQNPSDIIPGIQILKFTNSEEEQAIYKKFQEKIIEDSSLDLPCQFILEPLMNTSELVFRIIDTKFNVDT